MPIAPEPTRWALPDPRTVPAGEDVVAVGADLAPGTVLAAYARGLFPMHLSSGELAWWSPDPRGVLPLESLRVSRSLHRSMRRFTVTFDRAFPEVMRACAADRDDGSWITDEFLRTYGRLHDLGWAHSVEVWDDGRLAGGLYGLEMGGLFAGESMFHRRPDASKVALVALVRALAGGGGDRLLDVQWCTAHLASLGAVEVPRGRYLDLLAAARGMDPCLPPASWDGAPGRPWGG